MKILHGQLVLALEFSELFFDEFDDEGVDVLGRHAWHEAEGEFA